MDIERSNCTIEHRGIVIFEVIFMTSLLPFATFTGYAYPMLRRRQWEQSCYRRGSPNNVSRIQNKLIISFCCSGIKRFTKFQRKMRPIRIMLPYTRIPYSRCIILLYRVKLKQTSWNRASLFKVPFIIQV